MEEEGGGGGVGGEDRSHEASGVTSRALSVSGKSGDGEEEIEKISSFEGGHEGADAEENKWVHVFWHRDMLSHNVGDGVFDTLKDPGFLAVLDQHPEGPERLLNVVSILRKGPLAPYIQWHEGCPADVEELSSFHTQEYINELVAAGNSAGKTFCGGTRLNSDSWNAALLAAGSTLQAMQYIMEGHSKLAYSLVRPPGHHAQPSQADGYCFLNNVGLAIQLALDMGCKKVAVIDVDVHYGNGTAEGFYDVDNVFTISLHMNHGSWGSSHPQSGLPGEVGRGRGIGYNLNIPLPSGTGNKGYEYAMRELVIPAIGDFKPEIIIVAFGQDASAFDPNGRQCLTMAGYRVLGQLIRKQADTYTGGRVLLVQEGGYHVTYTAYCVHAMLEGILHLQHTLVDDPMSSYLEDEVLVVERIKEIQSTFTSTVRRARLKQKHSN